MTIINISLSVILVCAIFSIVCPTIKINPIAKGILCITMISVIGMLTKSHHAFSDIACEIFLSTVAIFTTYITYKAYQRGKL